ncbi:hypothetical protein DRH29_00040 [candidate division Kazan bacterium]|uniref:Methyltransferase domain-containing protein n=1 Tax=candidate division Kazan bacterium TaxID=2202143 RepID=A0A420ZDQ4_UNCK3|nr:MAG: hypothetical protein DRH29_00040 [candidate division Kazan bacterium]
MSDNFDVLIEQYTADGGGKIVLDLGAGEGKYSLKLARLGFRVLAVDLDTERLEKLREQAKRQGFDIQTQQSDVRNFDLTKQQYDFIVAVNSLHFLEKSEALDVIRRLHGALRAQGKLLMSVHHQSGKLFEHYKSHNSMIEPGSFVISPDKVISFFTEDEIKAALKGMKIDYLGVEQFTDQSKNQNVIYLLARKIGN